MSVIDVVPPVSGVRWVCLDIETIAGRPEHAERIVAQAYRPESFGSWKEETIGKRIKEAWAKRLERLALLNESPIVCVAAMSSEWEMVLFHWFGDGVRPAGLFAAEALAGARLRDEWAPDQAQMLVLLREWLQERCDQDTVLAGHAVKQFDLPKLRWAFCRAGLGMPGVLQNGMQPVFDSMDVYGRRFCLGGCQKFVGLSELLEEFGIESHKDLCSGDQVQALWDAKEWATIANYCCLDVRAEAELFLRMTGEAACLR